MTAATACRQCGTEPLENARFCHSCGAPMAPEAPAEYKQVTVLFADVVHSMDIAAAVGPERLREIMGELVSRSATVIQRYGGTVDKFTGDGIMALFGAPVALEDHAARACLAALGIQDEVTEVAVDVERQDRVALRLRVGLNSGQVITGEIGSGATGYTAVGEHVGLAQRMESVAPEGGVMLSESTARLVEHAVVLGEPEMVRIKGADDAVPARRLISTAVERVQIQRNVSTLVGRKWELRSIAEILDEAIDGAGCVVNVVGPPGIGKSRLAHEAAALAVDRGVDVITTFCESHAADIPFHAVARLLRVGMGVNDLDDASARARVRAQAPDAHLEDILLLDDLLGIADPKAVGPVVEADVRRRRLTALVNAATLARTTPALYVIEDVHWIDEVSESMLAAFMAVIPQSRSTVLLTYRPEYQGALARVTGTHTIALKPLRGKHTAKLVRELLGSDSSVVALAQRIAERAAGNPYFVEEMIRDLAERDVLDGMPGDYVLRGDMADVSVPATLQAAIASRIDRLTPAAKQTLSAAAVVGSRFSPDLLTEFGIDPALDELLVAQLVDQVKFSGHGEFAFHHPLVRAVAYESQLKSSRAELHRRLAGLIERRNPQSIDENAALIAEHLEAAGDLHDAFAWHMRAGTWFTNRDIAAARLSWERARQIADRLPVDDPQRVSMRIAPRTFLCLSVFRAGGTMEHTGFDELRELTSAAGDKVSLAIAMAGQVSALSVDGLIHEASQLASEHVALLDSIGDPPLTLALLFAAAAAKCMAGEINESLQLAQRMIDLADNDPAKGNLIVGSPLASALTLRSLARACCGDPGWKLGVDDGMEMAKATDLTTWAILGLFRYGCIVTGSLPADQKALHETAELLRIAERSGDDYAVASARYSRAVVLFHKGDGPERAESLSLFAAAREAALVERFTMLAVQLIDLQLAQEQLRVGDVGGAVDLSRVTVDRLYASGERNHLPTATTVLVESLLCRGAPADISEAESALAKLASASRDPNYVVYSLVPIRLRALLARAKGDEPTYRELAENYLKMAESLGFEGHIAQAKAML